MCDQPHRLGIRKVVARHPGLVAVDLIERHERYWTCLCLAAGLCVCVGLVPELRRPRLSHERLLVVQYKRRKGDGLPAYSCPQRDAGLLLLSQRRVCEQPRQRRAWRRKKRTRRYRTPKDEITANKQVTRQFTVCSCLQINQTEQYNNGVPGGASACRGGRHVPDHGRRAPASASPECVRAACGPRTCGAASARRVRACRGRVLGSSWAPSCSAPPARRPGEGEGEGEGEGVRARVGRGLG